MTKTTKAYGRPSQPGWYWFKLDGQPWRPLQVRLDRRVGKEFLACHVVTGLPNSTAGTQPIFWSPVAVLEGQWGPPIPDFV